MSKPLITIGDETREMNDVEFAQYQIDQQTAADMQAEIQAKANARAGLLKRLGITEEEAALLAQSL